MLYAAIILYCLLSSPTPDIMGWAEYGVGALLIIAVGFLGIGIMLSQDIESRTIQFQRLFILFMISIPAVIGVINGHPTSDIIRDIIPILFLILPLCFYGRNLDFLEVVLTIGGALFALRYLAPFIPYLDFIPRDTSLLYLANSPLVPFAAIIGFYWAVDKNPSDLTKRLFGFAIAVICFAAMMAMLQRAPVILSAIACFVILGMQARNKPGQSVFIAAIIAACLYPIYPIIVDIGLNLSEKTMTLGFNNRIEELSSAFAQTTWFGYGWGYEWQSPAVGGMWVRFTHNMVSYYALKAGIIGAIMAIGFIVMWVGHGVKNMKHSPEIIIAILIPLVIHMTLYTGFKTLDFALLLTLLMLCPRNRSLS